MEEMRVTVIKRKERKKQNDEKYKIQKGRRCKKRMDKYEHRIQHVIKESKSTENKNKNRKKDSDGQKLILI